MVQSVQKNRRTLNSDVKFTLQSWIMAFYVTEREV